MLRLTKWYCDCVSANGDVFLGYSASLSWLGFTIPYASSLVKQAHCQPKENRIFRACPAPAIHGGTLEWACPALQIQARWRTSQPACHQVLLDDTVGSIAWHCHVPGGAAHVELPEGFSVDGLGYAEELALSIPLSRLPFDVLQWGRFISNTDALVWIVWQGATSRQWVIHNGEAVSGATVDQRGVRLGDLGVLDLREAVPLREGPLASTVLRTIPGARRWLLRGIEQVHETKWLSAGTLTMGGRSSSGWAIHEVVRLRPG